MALFEALCWPLIFLVFKRKLSNSPTNSNVQVFDQFSKEIRKNMNLLMQLLTKNSVSLIYISLKLAVLLADIFFAFHSRQYNVFEI